MSHAMTQKQALLIARTLWGDTAFVQQIVFKNQTPDRWNRLRWPTCKAVVVGASGEVKGQADTWYCAFLAAGQKPNFDQRLSSTVNSGSPNRTEPESEGEGLAKDNGGSPHV